MVECDLHVTVGLGSKVTCSTSFSKSATRMRSGMDMSVNDNKVLSQYLLENSCSRHPFNVMNEF